MPQAQPNTSLTPKQRDQVYAWIEAGKSNEWIMSRSFMIGRSPVVLSGYRASYARKNGNQRPARKNVLSTKRGNKTVNRTQQRQIQKLSSDFANSIVAVLKTS